MRNRKLEAELAALQARVAELARIVRILNEELSKGAEDGTGTGEPG